MGKPSSFIRAITLAILGLSYTTGHATEDPQEQQTPSYTAEEVTISETRLTIPQHSSVAKLPLELHSTPASVSVVGQALLERQGGVILADALKNVSGANLQTGFGTFDFFVLRGFDSLESGLVLTDGAAEPEVSFYNLYNVETVEVLKGPAAFLYGGNPLSGVINLRRKQPVFADFARVNLNYGRYQSLRGTLDAGWADTEHGLALRLNALGQDAANYRDDKDSFSYAFNPSLTYKPNDRTRVTLNFEYAQSEHRSDSGLPLVTTDGVTFKLADVPRTRSYQSPFDISKQTFYRFRADAQRDLGEGLVLRNKFYFTDFAWPSKGSLINGDGTSLEVFRSLLDLDDEQRMIGNQLELAWNLNTGGFQHTLLTGLELGRWTDTFTLKVATLPNLDLFTPEETAAEPFAYIPQQQQAADARSVILAPYIVGHIVLAEPLELFVGGRYDRIDYEDNLNTAKLKFTSFSPMIGAIFRPLPDWSLYANAGRAFAPPSSRVVASRQAEAQFAGFGRKIKTEKSSQFELGAKKHIWDERVQANIAFFRLDKKDIAIRDANGLTQQSGDQRATGLEAEITARPAVQWHVFMTYAYTDAELRIFNEQVFVPTADGSFAPQTFDRAGNVPAFAPKHIASLWINKEFTNGLGLGGGGRYVGSQFIAPDNAYEIDSVLTFDAMASYTYDRWRLRLNLKNLTDKEYQTRGFGSSSVIPAPPFAAYGGIEWSL
jgi:TonB-dependent siderophore receptor